MSSLARTMLPAFALAALMATTPVRAAFAEDAHHPDGATTRAQSAPTPAPVPQGQPTKPGAATNAPMIGQGMGGGAVVQPGAQRPGGQPGMMMNMDQMHSMMGGMMGQQDGQSGTMGSGMMPMMRQMMMGQQGAMGLPFEHVEGRIAFLEAELGITDAQTPRWNAFADALRANAKAHRTVHEQMTKSGMPSAWPDRLALQQKALSTRLDALKTLEAAAKPLYAVLTEEQRKLADQLLAGPMGMM